MYFHYHIFMLFFLVHEVAVGAVAGVTVIICIFLIAVLSVIICRKAVTKNEGESLTDMNRHKHAWLHVTYSCHWS